jgi:dTDP-4-dehydrorhamnose reductase
MDLAKQIIDLGLSSSSAGVYHGTNSGEATWFDFAQVIFKLAGADTNRIVPVSSSEYLRPAKRPSYSVLSHDKWDTVGIAKMRDWKLAMNDSIKSIVNFSENEGE